MWHRFVLLESDKYIPEETLFMIQHQKEHKNRDYFTYCKNYFTYCKLVL